MWYLQDCDGDQNSIHPAVQKLIGKRPMENAKYEPFFNSNIWRWKREMSKKRHRSHTSNSHPLKIKMSNKASDGKNIEDTSVKPCYIPPSIPGNPQENSPLRGNVRKMHMRYIFDLCW